MRVGIEVDAKGIEALNFVKDAKATLGLVDATQIEVSTLPGMWVSLLGCSVAAVAGVLVLMAVRRERRAGR